MFTKFKIGLASLSLLVGLTTQAALPAASMAQEADNPVTPAGVVTEASADAAADSELMRVLRQEMTLVWLQDERYAFITAVCAGNGLNNIQPIPTGPMVLIPNAGDLAVGGSNVSIKLNPDGSINFIPRTQGQRILLPMEVGDKFAGQEVLSLTLAEAEQLAAAGHLMWTAQNQGPFGNGHALPGHIAACDPQYRAELYPESTADEE